MKYLAEALLAVIQGVKAAVVDPSHAELSRLLDCVYTLSYVNDRLIKEPLAKYAFIRKDAQLNEAYKLCTSTIKQYTQSYLQRSLERLLRALHECFDVDWVSYRTLQPVGEADVWDVDACGGGGLSDDAGAGERRFDAVCGDRCEAGDREIDHGGAGEDGGYLPRPARYYGAGVLPGRSEERD